MSKYVAERSKYQLFVEFLCRRNKWTNFLRRREILPNATLISTRGRRLRTRETTGIRCGLIGHGTTKIQARGWRERERETERNGDGDGDRYGGIVPGAQCAARVVLAPAYRPTLSEIDWRRTDRRRRSIDEHINCYRKRSRITLRN